MKKWIVSALACLFTIGLQAQKQDAYPALGAKLDEYFTALAGENADTQKKECDFLIESCKDSLVRQYVTLKIYDHYLRSKIMGDDAVAVYVADRWLLSGEVPMPAPDDLLNVRLFADFNRASLIGRKAPQLSLIGPDGGAVQAPAEQGYSALYFYDPGCSTCKLETLRLARFMEEEDFPFTLYAIDTGADADAWKDYRTLLPGAVHAWDPEMTSDWQRKYGVLQTPKLFLVSPSGVILGRGLDTPALRILLNQEFSARKYVYGDPAQMEHYAQLFGVYGDTLKTSDVMDVAHYLAHRTFDEGNVEAFKQVMGDFLYYLSSHKTEVYRDACVPFYQRYIDLPGVWNSDEDRAQVVSLGEMLADLTSRTPVGDPLPDVRVHGTMRRKPCLFRKGSAEGLFRLRSFKGKPGYLVFYSDSCPSCREMMEAVDRLVSANGCARVLLVDMDALLNDYPEEAKEVLDRFDVSAMPLVLELDKKGLVQHRYVDLTKLY